MTTLPTSERGAGSPVVLFHGAPSSRSSFGALVEALAVDHRVLMPSWPGYEGSPRLQPYAPDEAQRRLVATLHQLGVRQAALVGFSFGAYRALLAALDGVEATAVVCLGGIAATDPADAPALRGFADMLRPLPDLADPGLRHMFALRMLSEVYGSAHPEALDQVAAWLDATTPAVLADELAASAEIADLRPRLAEITVPVIARVGELDAAAPVARSAEIAAACRRGQLLVVPGCGHALLVEDAAPTIAAIRAVC